MKSSGCRWTVFPMNARSEGFTSPAEQAIKSLLCPSRMKMEFKRNKGTKEWILISYQLVSLISKIAKWSEIWLQSNNLFAFSVAAWWKIRDELWICAQRCKIEANNRNGCCGSVGIWSMESFPEWLLISKEMMCFSNHSSKNWTWEMTASQKRLEANKHWRSLVVAGGHISDKCL